MFRRPFSRLFVIKSNIKEPPRKKPRWLTAILKNAIIDYLRSAYSKAVEFKDDLYCETEEVFSEGGPWDGHWIWYRGPADWSNHPETSLENRQFWEALKTCVDELPAKFAVIFTLKELEELESKKICKDLEISESNFWVIMHRIRKQLRRCLEIRWLGMKPIVKRKK